MAKKKQKEHIQITKQPTFLLIQISGDMFFLLHTYHDQLRKIRQVIWRIFGGVGCILLQAVVPFAGSQLDHLRQQTLDAVKNQWS